MSSKDPLKDSIENNFKLQSKKDTYTWTYRYLRLHRELLEDSLYQEMYGYSRFMLLIYLNIEIQEDKMIKQKRRTIPQLFKTIDSDADFCNKHFPHLTEKRKELVEKFYQKLKERQSETNENRV